MVQYKNKELQFVYLRHACKRYLKQASECKSGRFYDCMTAMIYAAFLIESYLNEIGDHLFSDWLAEHDRKSVKEKVKLVAKKLQSGFDLGQVPFNAINEILEFRDLVVHAKAQNLSEDVSNGLAMSDHYWGPRSEMDKLATIDNAKRFLFHAEEIVKAINTHMPAGMHAHPVLNPAVCPLHIPGNTGGTI